MINTYSISLKGITKNLETSIQSFDLNNFQSHFLFEKQNS